MSLNEKEQAAHDESQAKEQSDRVALAETQDASRKKALADAKTT